MKITKRQLRRIIRETVYGPDDTEYDTGYNDGYDGYHRGESAEDTEEYNRGYDAGLKDSGKEEPPKPRGKVVHVSRRRW